MQVTPKLAALISVFQANALTASQACPNKTTVEFQDTSPQDLKELADCAYIGLAVLTLLETQQDRKNQKDHYGSPSPVSVRINQNGDEYRVFTEVIHKANGQPTVIAAIQKALIWPNGVE